MSLRAIYCQLLDTSGELVLRKRSRNRALVYTLPAPHAQKSGHCCNLLPSILPVCLTIEGRQPRLPQVLDTVQLCGMTVEADDTSDLPYSIFVLPQVNELRLADRHRPVGLMSAGH